MATVYSRCPFQLFMISGARIVITGGLGAIGSALCRALLKRNPDAITIIDDCSSSSRHLCADILSDQRVRHYQKSILNDEILSKVFVNEPQDIVFHLAAHFANQNSVDHPVTDCEVNSLGTMKVLEYARRGGATKFVFASSSCVYGNSENFSPETLKFHLDTPYAINKLHGEYLVKFYHDYHGMNATVLRYFNSFGPGELPGQYRNVVPNFFARAMKGLPLPITGSPDATRDFNFVDNVVQGTILSVEVPESAGRIYNIGSGEETSIGRLAELINGITGNIAGTEIREQRSWDSIMRRKADITRTKEELGYEPVMDLSSQLQATYDWLKENKHYFPVV